MFKNIGKSQAAKRIFMNDDKANWKVSAKKSSKQTKTSPPEFFERVQKKAYELFEQRGCTPGNELSDWYEAERIVKAEVSRKI